MSILRRIFLTSPPARGKGGGPLSPKRVFSLLLLAAALWVYGSSEKNTEPSTPDAPSAFGPASQPSSGQHWTDTQPAVNETHIFQGTINSRARPVGFHARPGGKDPDTARLVAVTAGPNTKGVYIADVEILDPSTDAWKPKRSTFFPDALSEQQTIAAILNAQQYGQQEASGKFRGPSGLGFEIEGWMRGANRINTAYPTYRAD